METEYIHTTLPLRIHSSDITGIAKYMTDAAVISCLTEFRCKFTDDEYSKLVPAFVHKCRPAIVAHLFKTGARLLDNTGYFYSWKRGTFDIHVYAIMVPVLAPELQKLTDRDISRLAEYVVPSINKESVSEAHTEFLVRAYSLARGRLPKPVCPKVIAALADKGYDASGQKSAADPRDTEIKTLKEELDILKATIASVTKVINE